MQILGAILGVIVVTIFSIIISEGYPPEKLKESRCPFCGAPVRESDQICGNCGYRLDSQ